MRCPRRHLFPLVLLSSLCSLWLCGESTALDPETKKPYNLEVVLHVADNRALTPIFQEQLERELRAKLQLGFGKLANVQVVRSHPLLREILAKGLQQALDGWEQLSDRQTHFVLVDFVQGRYELQTGSYDGMTGLAAPVVRKASPVERRQVVEQAVRLIKQEFAPVGTVVKVGGEVEVAFKGGAIEAALGLKAGDVFAIVRLTEQGGKIGRAHV